MARVEIKTNMCFGKNDWKSFSLEAKAAEVKAKLKISSNHMDSNQSNHQSTLPFSHKSYAKKKMRLNRPKMYQDEINSL